jgi:hypothetical protein
MRGPKVSSRKQRLAAAVHDVAAAAAAAAAGASTINTYHETYTVLGCQSQPQPNQTVYVNFMV